MSNEVKISLHDLNQTIVAQLKEIPQEEKDLLIQTIEDVIKKGKKYFMLLSNEKRDYTIFNMVSTNHRKVVEEIMEILENRGKIKDFELTASGALEVWVGSTFYALFPYDLGVIEV
ncbi:hypothetical protein [Clostridium sp.]|uniref:hypothetical protein n=1 Tax=Clostridium sp. TaxID=1506 RepID=UPI002FC861D6